MSIGVTRPARGTRPANRRELILEAAAELFYRDGYVAVGMSDIADAVSIGPSALYRHFGSKQELLGAVVLGSVEQLYADLADVAAGDLASTLARAALQHRRAGMTWRREVRYLSGAARAEFRERARAVRVRTAELLAERRPDLAADRADLAARCALAVVASVSFHSVQLPDERMNDLLRAMIEATIAADYAPHPDPPVSGISPSATSRREEIFAAAAELFAAKGFSNVGLEEIGARVGIAGPSIYNHFQSKGEILYEVLMRGNEWLRFGLTRALADASDEADALERSLSSYVDFAVDHPDFVALLLTDVVELPEAQRHRALDVQRAYVAEWVHLLTTVEPGVDPAAARLRVQAAIHIANEVALGQGRAASGVRAVLRSAGNAVLHAVSEAPQ